MFRAWCSGRSNLYHEDNGTHIEMYHEVKNTAIQWACGKPYGGSFTPRRSLIGSVIVVMGRVAEQHWDLDQELSCGKKGMLLLH